DLSCQNRRGRAEVVANLLELVGNPSEELGVTGGLAVLAVRHEVMDQHFGGALAVAVDAAVPLFETNGREGNLDVDQPVAMFMQVDALRCGIGSEQNAHRRDLWVVEELLVDAVPLRRV